MTYKSIVLNFSLGWKWYLDF